MPFGLTDSSTLEESKQRLCQEFYTCNSVVDLKFEEERISELEESCSLPAFLIRCEALSGPFTSCLARTTANLAPPPGLFDNFALLVKQEAVKMYKLQVEAAARAVCKDEKTASRQTENQRKALEEAAALKPEEVLGRAFASFVKKGNKTRDPKKPTVDYSKMLNLTIASPTLAEPSAQPRNAAAEPPFGKTPGEARGQNSAKGNGKGRGKSGGKSTKGSGKGKGHGTDKGQGRGAGAKGSGKGKGRGKGKGKGAGQSEVGKKGKKTKSGIGGKSAGKGGGKASRR
jgi:hypothetical protein